MKFSIHFSSRVFLISLLGIIAQYSSIWQMGIATRYGLTFCCRSVNDNLFHFALTNSLTKTFPPQEPGMSGLIVHSYHYLSNLVIAEIVKVFYLPLFPTQGLFFPLLFSILLAGSIVCFGQLTHLSKTALAWILFFVYFHGDILYLLILISTGKLNLSFTVVDDATKLLTAPPLYFATALFFAVLSFLYVWLSTRQNQAAVIAAIVIGSLIGFKVYIGIVALVGLTFLLAYILVKEKKIQSILPFFIAYIIAAAIYLPVNASAGGLVWSGFWRTRDFIVQTPLYLSHLELARQTYLASQHNFRAFMQDVYFLLTFCLFIFGTTLFALLQTRKSISMLSLKLHIFLIPGIIFSFIAGLFTLQTVGGANTVQFLIFLQYILSLYAGLAVASLLRKMPQSTAFIAAFMIILLTITRAGYESYVNFALPSRQDTYHVPKALFQAASAIEQRASANSIVLTDTNFFDTKGYILPVLSNRKMFLLGTQILQDHGVTVQPRQQIVDDIQKGFNVDIQTVLRQNKIKYILWSKIHNLSLEFGKPVFENSEYTLYRLD